MKTLQTREESQTIKDPLWNLMLSTNDCYPGCSCDSDFFDITPERVQQWVRHNGSQNAKQALVQLNELTNSLCLNL